MRAAGALQHPWPSRAAGGTWFMLNRLVTTNVASSSGDGRNRASTSSGPAVPAGDSRGGVQGQHRRWRNGLLLEPAPAIGESEGGRHNREEWSAGPPLGQDSARLIDQCSYGQRAASGALPGARRRSSLKKLKTNCAVPGRSPSDGRAATASTTCLPSGCTSNMRLRPRL